MKKKFLALILALSLVLSLVACGGEAEPEAAPDNRPTADSFLAAEPRDIPDEPDEPDVPSEEDEPEEPEIPEEPETPNEPAFTWLVEPVLEYDWIFSCDYCDMFVGMNFDDGAEYNMPLLFDELDYMGQLTGELHESHLKYELPGNKAWLYDPDLDLFGWYQWISLEADPLLELKPMSEFAEHFPDEVDTIKLVRRVDTTMRNGSFINWEEAWSDSAVAFGNEFVTDFIFYIGGHGKEQQNIMSLPDTDSNFGVINKNGETIVPFIFNYLTLIDENTAFARLGAEDNWGIISF
jgi:hypothetical protein